MMKLCVFHVCSLVLAGPWLLRRACVVPVGAVWGDPRSLKVACVCVLAGETAVLCGMCTYSVRGCQSLPYAVYGRSLGVGLAVCGVFLCVVVVFEFSHSHVVSC